MALPPNLDELCCDQPWTENWIEEFSRWDFFYVSNLLEVMIEDLGLKMKARRRYKIRNIHGSAKFPTDWYAFFPNHFSKKWCQENGHDEPESDEFDKLVKELGREVFFKAVNGKPVSFAKAALIVQAMDAELSNHAPAREKLCIDFANYYLDGFENTYSNHLAGVTDATAWSEIYTGTLQVNRKLFTEMARGYAVTYGTAQRVASFCKGKFGDDLMIRPYDSRTEDSEDRLDALSGKNTRRSMRSAAGEVVIFRPNT